MNISNFLEQKISAISCYQLELREFPHPRSIEGVITKARNRGMEVGIKYAEGFKILRWIDD